MKAIHIVPLSACAVALAALAAHGAPDEIRVSSLGFDREDSTRFLQAAIDSGAKRVIVDRMDSPWVTLPLFAASGQHIVFEPGVTLLAKRGAFKGKNDCLFSITNAVDVRLSGKGATFRMWRVDYVGGKDYVSSDWRHTIIIRGSRNVVVEGIRFEESGGDGIYIRNLIGGPPAKDITIRGCVFDRHHRQGMSVISAENLLVEDCTFSNISGTAPSDGVDIEPNKPYESLLNVVFRNCAAENNAGVGFEVALSTHTSDSRPSSIRFEGCRASGNFRGAKIRTRRRAKLGGYPRGTVTFERCAFERTRHNAVTVMQNPEGALDLSLLDCTFREIGVDDASTPAIMLESPFADDPRPAKPRVAGLSWPDRGVRALYGYDTANFEALEPPGSTLPFLAPDVAGAEVHDPAPGRHMKFPPVKLRFHARLASYADRPRRISVTGSFSAAGKGRNAVCGDAIKVTDAAGRDVSEIAPPDAGPAELAFDAPAAGFYFIDLSLGKRSLALDGSNAPLALDSSRWGERLLPVSLTSLPATFYVPLKAGQRAEFRMAGSAPCEKIAVAVSDDEGREVFSDPDLVFWTRFKAEAAGRDGVWRWAFSAPRTGILEDYRFEISGVRPFLFPSKDRFWYAAPLPPR